MSSYFSIEYLALFLPAVLILYNLMPQRYRWLLLLFASYLFFWLISGVLILYLLTATLTTYIIALHIGRLQQQRNMLLQQVDRPERKAIRISYQKKQQKFITAGVLILLGMLIVLKYSGFIGINIQSLLNVLHLPLTLQIPSFVLPIGISFYTLQALSYLFDVYREKIQAEWNLGRLALYLAFFLTIIEGPICRYSDLSFQLYEGKKISWNQFLFGMQRIVYGLMKKIVIADRLNLFIKTIFHDYNSYDGGMIALGALLYTCQLYMEFSGTMDVIIGSGEMFALKIEENFRQPFFSKTISEFWQRWHISLGLWFKDYIFYPLSMSKPLKKLTAWARKKVGNHYGPLASGAIALFCVWLANGFWHGSGWNYIFFGLYHFTLILGGSLIEPVTSRIVSFLRINKESAPYQFFQIIRTSVFVVIGELFFRAKGLKAGIHMFITICTNFSWTSLSNSIFSIGMDRQDFIVVIIGILIVFMISVVKERGLSFRALISGQPVMLRWSLYYMFILFIVIFGAYGVGYIPVDPIYANF
ncbi:MBOAT family O-acyltransferase [uncultured Traorella sp.]|uniref:MBOAT family O-acyltransferase n=1 Tax=uncultured Traorella sp. TaxID=1929048 RepID=UPI0025D26668|nr:MBOAT family O-acyltransferase [uncultured Traorella sp.]